MRFREFKVTLKEAEDNVVVIGDSIAVGIGGASPYAQGGISAQEVLNRVNAFVKTGKAKGATVILSTGASNSAAVELENGTKIPSKLGSYPEQQIKTLITAGAKVAVVGVSSQVSGWFPATKFTNGSKYRVDLTGVNDQLESAANSNGAKFLGPLEQYDPGMHSGKGDGLHPFGGYKKLYQTGVSVASGKSATTNLGPKDTQPGAPTTKDKEKTAQGAQPSEEGDVLTSVTTPNGIMGPDVADIQKVLKAAGYGQLLGPFGDGGVDGIIGKYTRNTIATFQKDNNLKVTSAADADTVAKLNGLLSTKFKDQLTKSTPKEVVRGQPGATAYNAEGGPGLGETGSTKAAIEFFRSRGWTLQQAAGIVGNLQAESGANLRTNAVGDSGQAYGIAQWHPDRQANFARVVGKDIRESTFTEQLAFVQWELENTESKAGNKLKQAQTAAEAAEIFDQYYERSSGQHRQARINNAVALAPTTGTAVA